MHEPPIVGSPPPDPPPPSPQPDSGWRKAIDNRWLMLGMLFFVTAALGLPLLWKSRAFSQGEKWFWSLAISLYTLLLLLVFGWVMWWSYTRIAEALASATSAATCPAV